MHGLIEKIATDTPTREDRRLMCELLAEVGRNPIIVEINRNVDARLRASLEAALVSLAPLNSGQFRATITDFIISLSWGLVDRKSRVVGKGVSVRVDPGCRRCLKKKKRNN